MKPVTISHELAQQLHDLVLAAAVAAAADDPEHWAALKQLNLAMANAANDTSAGTSEAEQAAYRILRDGGYVTSGDACDIIDQLKSYLRANSPVVELNPDPYY